MNRLEQSVELLVFKKDPNEHQSKEKRNKKLVSHRENKELPKVKIHKPGLYKELRQE